MIGRNSSLLQHVTGGFVEINAFAAYVLCTLTVIQIWNFSTYYINMHGRNGLRDHVFICINMYLLYLIGQGTRLDHFGFQVQYHIAWGLILINIGVQYFLELRNHRDDPVVSGQIRRMGIILFTEAFIVFLSLPVRNVFGISIAPLAVLFGIGSTMFHGGKVKVLLVDFAHLTERAMLYVVFTFGEMIIVLAGYFDDRITPGTIYLSLMGFLIIVGLFLSYETAYDHLIDREKKDNGLLYMLLHIFLIFALNLLTTSLEFMHDAEVDLMPKLLMLIFAFLLYYTSLFGILRYNKTGCRPDKRFAISITLIAASFVVLMLVFRSQMYLNIALTVVYVLVLYAIIYKMKRATPGDPSA